MALEIDMLAVGDASAIIIRITHNGQEQVVVIDGGNSSDGQAVIDHVETWTDRGNHIDLLISTHPDADHIDGLHPVVNALNIDRVWIHDPSTHGENVKTLVRELWSSQSYVIREAAKSLDSATGLITTISSRGILRIEPFAGTKYSLLDGGVLTVIGPTQDYYEELLSTMKQRAEKSLQEELIMEQMLKSARAKSDLTARQLLDEGNDTSPSNNTSVILFLTYQSSTYLFTADAGPSALEAARVLYPQEMKNVSWLQVPHHGSRKNLTCDLIDYIHPVTAYISAKASSEHHPHRAVVEVLKEIGCRVYCTHKTAGSIHHSYPPISRAGYSIAEELELSDLP